MNKQGEAMSQNKLKKDKIADGDQLPGWPGYRTRANRSGLDPLDTRAEAAHMEGTFLRNIFTLRARTRNPFYLFLMFVFGVIPFLVFVVLITNGLPGSSSFSLVPTIYFILFIFVTAAVTTNFLLSILEILGVVTPRKPVGKRQPKEQKKKLQKRRKDFR